MEFIKQFFFSFICTIGFAIFFSIPKNSILKSGITGAIGWVIYIQITNIFSSTILGIFCGALTVGILGEMLARNSKKPATVFIIPGIVPLVPGSGMYYTMLAITEKRFNDAANIGTETIFIAVAIAMGIIISSSLSKSIKRVKNKS